MPPPPAPDLRGRTILVTRPAHQAENFSTLLAQAGAEVIRCPAIRISEPADPSGLKALVEQLDAFDFLMFNSPNAANCGIAFIHAHRRIPARMTIGAIGAKTATAVAAWGYTVHVSPPADFDSEAFLRLPLVSSMRGKRVAILRGQDGRMLLGETLRQRGARVDFVETYQRLPPSPEQAEQIREALQRDLDAIAITSSEALNNLAGCLDPQSRDRLAETLLIVGHPRIDTAAHSLGLNTTITAADPSDESMFAAIARHLSRQAPGASSRRPT